MSHPTHNLPGSGHLEALSTEQINPRTGDIDLIPVGEALLKINDEDRLAVQAVRSVIPAVERAVLAAEQSLRAGGRLIYVGAGTSGRLGCLDAAEIPPTYGMEPDRVIALIAGGDRALRESIEGAEDDPLAGAADLAALGLHSNDMVCGIAASGRTPYVLGALREARRAGAVTAGITTNQPSELDPLCDILINPLVGPEPVSGSTRMKSGTAQKLILNMLSTMLMIRLGKTHGNLMIDLKPTNEKLRQRARRLVRQILQVDEQTAERLFAESGNDTRLAIFMGLSGLDAEQARRDLAARGGVIRRDPAAAREP